MLIDITISISIDVFCGNARFRNENVPFPVANWKFFLPIKLIRKTLDFCIPMEYNFNIPLEYNIRKQSRMTEEEISVLLQSHGWYLSIVKRYQSNFVYARRRVGKKGQSRYLSSGNKLGQLTEEEVLRRIQS